MNGVGTDLSIVHLYPTLLGLYGDRGNALVLERRAATRGLRVELINVEPGAAVPRLADIYLLGGGEDIAQVTANQLLADDGGLVAAAQRGAVVLAVCAGLQILGAEFDAADARVRGLGVVDATTSMFPTRSVGELLTEPVRLGVPLLSGFENHSGRTTLGADVEPLGRVISGIGNGTGDPSAEQIVHDGFVQGRIVGTYLHGPVLARNPALADLLLSWATGHDVHPMDDHTAQALRAERLAAVLSRQKKGRRLRIPGRRAA